MPDVFTRHVRDLGTPKDRFEKFWKQFLRDLESEMRSRRLFNAAPPFLGAEYDEYVTWHDPVAFEALATDCYMAAVLKRVKPLRDMLQQSSSVAGAVRKNIKYFLIDRQRKANPMGYKLFKNVEGILQEEIDQGRLAIQGTGDGKLRNETILLLDSEARPGSGPRCGPRRLLDSSELWSDVVRVVAGPEDDARKPLVDALSELRAAGVGVLRLGDLLVALRGSASGRSIGRSAAIWNRAPGLPGRSCRTLVMKKQMTINSGSGRIPSGDRPSPVAAPGQAENASTLRSTDRAR